MDQPSCKWNLLRLFTLICTTLVSTLSFGQAGNAPMQALPNFTGPMAINGFVTRQGTAGDWLPGPGGATNTVFTNTCVALVPLAYRLTDLFNDQVSDDIFDGGNKLNDDPNDWGWRSQKPPAKDDINTAMVFIALNPVDNHIWLAISGDRMSTNGTSYLDFEFYQNSITKVGGPTTGGFVSTGPHGGRTVGDISITLEYTGGGSFATVKYQQWQPGSEAGSYDYFDVVPAPGTAFAAANAGAIDVPCGAFGSTTYEALQFVEGAIDLTALIGGTGLPGECGSLPFKTLFIKSKSSAEKTADLKDFISPFDIDICFDVTAPIITCPPTLNLACNATPPPPNGGIATDNCDGTVIPVSSDGPILSSGCNRSMNRRWTAIDECGNMSTCNQQINWSEDHTGPAISTGGTGPALGCNPSAGDINAALGTASASDGCSTPTITQSDGSVSSNGCGRSQTRTWTARDACGNTSSASRTATWTADVTAPVITAGGTTTTLACNPSAGDINGALGTATATDACATPTVTSSDGSIGSNGCGRSQTRTFTARDACGNTATASRTVTWTSDVTGPVTNTGGSSISLCNPTAGDINAALGTASATDACGGATIIGATDGPVTTNGCQQSQTRTFTARDACGNTSTASRTANWAAESTPPVITTGGTGTTLGCNPSGGDINGALGTATATDACSTPTLSSSDGSVSSNGCARSQTRTWTARDGCGNTSTASRTVTWTADITPPVITVNPTIQVILGCNPTAGEINTALGTASASDVCGNPTLTSSDGPVTSDGCFRSQTRTWTARDACGNTATALRSTTWTADFTAPVLSTGGCAILGCNPSAGDINSCLGTATATDACGVATVSVSDGSVTSNGCSRSQTRRWTARDACGNTSTASRTTTWTVDVTPPVFTPCPASVDLDCGTAIPSASAPSATDACGVPTITQTGSADNAADCATGFSRVVTRTWTARDACGNTSTCSQTIRVRCCPAGLCTYTQGAYGTEGGTMCDGENGGFTTLEFITNSLANWGGSFSVGKPGHSVLVNSAQCVLDKLPGGGPAKELVAGDINLCVFTPLQQNGGVRNILLAQTITLGLNLGIENSQLGSFVLQVGELATQDPLTGCGDDTPETRVCHYNVLAPFNLVSVENEYTYRTFTQEVIDAIPGANTVANLYELANRALANVDGVVGSEGGASLDAINNAVSSVNEVFDNCKITVGWNVSRCPAIDPTPGDGRITPSAAQEESVVANRSVPGPFNVPAIYRTRIMYTVGVGQYNAKGVVLSPN